MNIEGLMGYAAVLIGVLGSWGLYRQAKMIWTSKSAKSVSGTWVVTFLAMFVAFLLYGLQQSSFPMEIQGWLRVAFSLPVVIGYFTYGDRKDGDWFLVLLYTFFLSLMGVKAVAPALFVIFLVLGIWSSFIQALTIRYKRSRGKVAVELQVIYLVAVVCWLVYGLVRKDVPLISTSIGFALSYSTTIAMWLKYP